MDYSLLIICVHLKKLKYTRSKSNTPGVANKQSCNMVHQYRIQSMWVIQSQCIIRFIFILYQQCFCTNSCGKHLGWRIKLSVKHSRAETHTSPERKDSPAQMRLMLTDVLHTHKRFPRAHRMTSLCPLRAARCRGVLQFESDTSFRSPSNRDATILLLNNSWATYKRERDYWSILHQWF